MPLYAVQIHKCERETIFAFFKKNNIEIITHELIPNNDGSCRGRFEIDSKLDEEGLTLLFQENYSTTKIALKRNSGFYNKPIMNSIVSSKISELTMKLYTSQEMIEKLKNEFFDSPENIKNLHSINNRIGFLSDGMGCNVRESVSLDLQRDALLLSGYTDLYGVPVFFKSKNEDEFIRHAIAISDNFFALRISNINRNYDEEEYTRIENSVSIPVFFKDTAETAPAISALVANVQPGRGRSLEGKRAAIVGISTCAQRIAILLGNLGVQKVFGIDSEPAHLSRFERGYGIVSTMDQAYDNADIIILMPDTKTVLDESRLNSGQSLISFHPKEINIEKLDPDVLSASYIGAPPHSNYTLPGIISFINEKRPPEIREEFYIKVMNSLLTDDGNIMPEFSMDFIKNQTDILCDK